MVTSSSGMAIKPSFAGMIARALARTDAPPQCTSMCWTCATSTTARSWAGWRSGRSGTGGAALAATARGRRWWASALPCRLLRPYLAEARRVIGLMPGPQGVMPWPAGMENVSVLCEETHWPMPTGLVDRLVLMHGLETSEHPSARAGGVQPRAGAGGRALFIVPNRSGLWARRDGTPFGFGRPYSLAQLEAQLKHHGFTPERSQSALFAPPSNTRFWLRTADFWEGDGAAVVPWLAGGVLMVEASKQIYAPTRPGLARRWCAARCGCWKGCPRRCPRRRCATAMPDGGDSRRCRSGAAFRLPQLRRRSSCRMLPRKRRKPRFCWAWQAVTNGATYMVAGCADASATRTPKFETHAPRCAPWVGSGLSAGVARCRAKTTEGLTCPNQLRSPRELPRAMRRRSSTWPRKTGALAALEADIDALDAALAASADLRDHDRLAAGQPRRSGQRDRGDCREDGPVGADGEHAGADGGQAPPVRAAAADRRTARPASPPRRAK